MSETVLFIDELTSSSVISACRICHEQEFEGYIAYRDGNEKGNTTCEICLQKFKPGYTAPPKKSQLIHTTATIRGSLVVPTNEPKNENSRENLETNYTGCISAAENRTSFCRSLALIFTALLMIRHSFDVLTGGAQGYPFSLLTGLLFKATGIIVPMYILIRGYSSR